MHRTDDSAARCAGCKHVRRAHEHYRRGTDCSACACRRFVRPGQAADLASSFGRLLKAMYTNRPISGRTYAPANR